MKLRSIGKVEIIPHSILTCSLILLSSCVHCSYDPSYAGPAARTEQMLSYYSYPQTPAPAKIEKLLERRNYVLNRVEIPSTKNVFGTENIRFDYYEQKQEGKFPTILVLPITSGIAYPVRSLANCLASKGFNCAIVHNRKAELDEIRGADEFENYFRQSVLDNRQVLDYLVQHGKVDEDRIGSLGISLGGVKSAITAGVDERLKCNVMCLAGGSIADIICDSNEDAIKDYRSAMAERGTSLDDLYREFSERIVSDPLKLAKYIDARGALMYIALFDRTVPKRCGDKLREAMGRPEVVYLFAGHYTSIIYLPYVRGKTVRFFKEKFGVR